MKNNKEIFESHFIDEGTEYIATYQETDSFEQLNLDHVTQAYGLCVLTGRKSFILVHNSKRGTWGYPGGGKESGETLEETMRRELLEETGLEAKTIKPIGYQTVTDSTGNHLSIQVRYFCIIKNSGLQGYKTKRVIDPDEGEVDMIKAIPLSWKHYFPDWGEIGDKIQQKAEYLNDLLNH